MTAILPTADLTDEGLLLDLLNTTPVVDGVRRDQLAEGSTARTWLQAHGGSGTTKELAQVRAVRAVLQGVVRGGEAPTALAPFLGSVIYRASVYQPALRPTPPRHEVTYSGVSSPVPRRTGDV